MPGVQGRLVALTFDDGPSAATTPHVLDLLARHRARATFFVVGSCAEANPDLVRRIAAAGHAIGNHSYTHPSSTSRDSARLELDRTQAAIEHACGRRPSLFRPPYGIVTGCLAAQAKARRMITVIWSVDSEDWKPRSAADIARRSSRGVRPGDIVLLHDIHARTLKALPSILDTLEKRGFRFVTVPELLRSSIASPSVKRRVTLPPNTPPASMSRPVR